MSKLCFSLCLALLLGLGITSAQAQEAAELETFIDALMTGQLEAYQIPGSVVVIVQDGEVALAKGYGYANVEHQLKKAAEVEIIQSIINGADHCKFLIHIQD